MFLQLSPAVVESIGYVAGALTTLAFVPQVVKTWRSRSSGDLSGTMLASFTTGVFLWMVYGVAVRSLPVVVTNGVTLCLSGTLFALKLRAHRLRTPHD